MCLSLLWALLVSNPTSPSQQEVCYSSIGCFRNIPPWRSNIRPALLPQDPRNLAPSLTVYRQDLPHGSTFPLFPDDSPSEIPLHDNIKTVVILHGLLSNATSPWILELKDVILQREAANVLVADYGTLSLGAYEQVLGDMRAIAALCAQVLTDISGENVHLVGHSIGAHIAAYIANGLAETGKSVSQITGLDPAASYFEGQSPVVSLDPSDAEFVEIIHTNAGEYGFMSPLGHSDYYFNGGIHQPPCRNEPNPAMCSHKISTQYYVEAVESECFYGKPGELVKDWSGMISGVRLSRTNGEQVQLGRENVGVYIVDTKAELPYCP